MSLFPSFFLSLLLYVNSFGNCRSEVFIIVQFFLIRIVDGVELGPLGTSATSWPIVPVPGDYEDGEFGEMKIGGGNQST
jgi:hypothetical protein